MTENTIALRKIAAGWLLSFATAFASAPTENDVLMRTLEFRDVPPGSPMDVFQAIDDFHVTRLEWTYIDFDGRNRECIERVKEMGVVFGGAGSASMHEKIANYPPQAKTMHMLDLDGNMIVQPHMRGWKDQRGIGDPSNPDFYAHHLGYWKKVIDWGAQTLQRDEPESPVFAAARYGGGFTPSGIAGFREWLREHADPDELAALGIHDLDGFDYGDWLRERGAPSGDAFANFDDPLKDEWVRYWTGVTTDFWTRMIADIRAHANDPELTISCNNSSLQMWEPYHRVFDYAISELLVETAHPVHLWERARLAHDVGKFQVFGAPKTRSLPIDEAEKNLLLRRVIATSYACGMLAKLPWDVFDQSPDGQARYFAKPEDIADLTAFIRGAGDWSGYREIAAIGQGIPDPEGNGIRIEGGSGGVYAFLREPEDPSRPMLLHLVEWGLPTEEPTNERQFYTTPSGEGIRMYAPETTTRRSSSEPFTLVLPRKLFPAGSKPDFQLLVPAAYNPELHAATQASGDFQPLVSRIPLEVERSGENLRIAIPALSPWGVLRISESPNNQPAEP